MENAIRILKEKSDALHAEFRVECAVKLEATTGGQLPGIWYHVWIDYASGAGDTIDKAEEMARERHITNDPVKKLEIQAAAAGYKLVKLEAAQ